MRMRNQLKGGQRGHQGWKAPAKDPHKAALGAWQMGPAAAGDASSQSAKRQAQDALLQHIARMKKEDETTLSMLWKRDCDDGDDPRIRAMRQAATPNPDGAGGQEEPDWDDVVQYMRGVGGNALRFIGVDHQNVRSLGLV